MESFIKLFTKSVNKYWDSKAVLECQGSDYTYKDLALQISAYQQLWQNSGLTRGDKIAICAKNCKNWPSVYMAIVTGGYIAVLIPNNITQNDVVSYVNHSESLLLYTDDSYELSSFSTLSAIFDINDNSIISSREESFGLPRLTANSVEAFTCSIINDIDDICTIAYSSGTTGKIKAIMLSYKNISFHTLLEPMVPYINNECLICILPFFHVYGLLDNLILPLCYGLQIVLPNSLAPSNLCSIWKMYRCRIICTVPQLLLAILNTTIGIELNSEEGKSKLSDYQNNKDYCDELRTKFLNALGGNVEMILYGGSKLSPEMLSLLVNALHLPISVGYGLTECPCVSAGFVDESRPNSSGKIIRGITIRLDSEDPQTVPGEIQVRGDCVFSGYYKDIETTEISFTDDGWFKTGDLGVIDENDNLYITGRCKDMLLTSNGQNVYPEEIEETMNVSPYIKESILVQRGEKLFAIVVPDREKAEADNLDEEALERKIDEAVREASKKLPGFTIISSFELRDEPLERTPKGSLKRYLYSDGIKEN